MDSWELLVVDDGSTDDSADVVEALAAEDPRVVLLRQPHAGVCAARNLGLDRARGRYVAFLDSDNEYLPDFLQVAVSAMAGQGLRAAYALLRADDDGEITYRTLEAGDDVLRVRNFIDLNVLVVERDLLQEVGGFDASLRRTVDYDLVLRLRRHTEIPLLPFLAVDYHHDSEDTQRITNREAASWVEVVQSRAFVDWSGLAAREQTPGRTSVVVVVDRFEEPRATWEAVGLLLASFADDEDVQVVLADNGAPRATAVVLDAWAVVDPRVTVHHEPVDRFRALATDLALASCTGDVVVVAPLGMRAEPGWVRGLRAGLADDRVAAVQPLLVQPSGTIASLGAVRPPGRGMPAAPARRPPRRGRPGRRPRPARPGARRPARRRPLRRPRRRGRAGPAVPQRVGRRATSPCAWPRTGASCGAARTRWSTLPLTSRSRSRAVDNPVNRGLFGERWGPAWGRRPRRGRSWACASSRGSSCPRGAGSPPGPASPSSSGPGRSRAGLEVADRPVRRRWAVKTGAPAGPEGRAWGDVHFAGALADALGRLGQDVVVDSRQAHERGSAVPRRRRARPARPRRGQPLARRGLAVLGRSATRTC